ncbi:MAG: tetratricopeptide repeat protein [Sphingobacteriaceae bacterium]|nr:tetratricopeptide repeat protein [Sphingobacteriaceae bacterium]
MKLLLLISDTDTTFVQAKNNILSAKNIALQLKENNVSSISKNAKIGLAAAEYRLGVLSKKMGELEKTEKYFQNTCKLMSQAENPDGLANTLLQLAYVGEEEGKSEEVLHYYQKVIRISKLTGNKKILSTAFANIGFHEGNKSNYDAAIKYFQEACIYSIDCGDINFHIENIMNLAYLQFQKGNIPEALANWHKCLKHYEKIENKNLIATVLNNIAHLYQTTNDEKAIEYFQKALIVAKEINSERIIAYIYNNIALEYDKKGDNNTALYYHRKSLALKEKLKDNYGIAGSYVNIASILTDIENYSESNELFNMALQKYRNLGDKGQISNCMSKLSLLYIKKYLHNRKNVLNIKLAKAYADSSLQIALNLMAPSLIVSSTTNKYKIDSILGDFKSSMENYRLGLTYSSIINNEKNNKLLIRSQINYEFEKKEALLLKEQEKERLLSEEKNRVQKIIIFAIAFGLLLVIIVSFYIFRTLKVTKKQKEIIEEKQCEILDSIHYAKRIQNSLLPTHQYIEKILSEKNKIIH